MTFPFCSTLKFCTLIRYLPETIVALLTATSFYWRKNRLICVLHTRMLSKIAKNIFVAFDKFLVTVLFSKHRQCCSGRRIAAILEDGPF